MEVLDGDVGQDGTQTAGGGGMGGFRLNAFSFSCVR